MKTTALLFAWICYAPMALANYLPKTQAVPGGIEILRVKSHQKPIARFDKKPLAVVNDDKTGEWLVIIGLPLDTKPGKQIVSLRTPVKKWVAFDVENKAYRTQYITIKNKRKVTPNPTDVSRIKKERQQIDQTLETYSKASPFEQQFIAPIKGPITSQFGLKRVYNKQPRNPHSGLDIAAPKGTPVHTIAKGKVIATDDLFFTGNTVIVDHGHGILSIYGHLSKIDVKPGQNIQQGDVIGKVGKTGRATGPHLHWEMIVNQTRVNPLLFVPASAIKPKPKKTKKINTARNG